MQCDVEKLGFKPKVLVVRDASGGDLQSQAQNRQTFFNPATVLKDGPFWHSVNRRQTDVRYSQNGETISYNRGFEVHGKHGACPHQ